MFLVLFFLNKATEGAILGKKYSTSEKNQYSMIEVLAKISSILYLIIKYIL